MHRRLKLTVLVIVLVLVLAQLVRPSRTNPPTNPSRTLQASGGNASGLGAIVDRACRDCHTNATVWPSYAGIAPLSWLMAYAVREGRRAVNFSEWAGYPPERQRELLAASCEDVSKDKMPGSAWIKLHPEARLSAQDIEAFCAAARTPLTSETAP